MTRYGNRRGRRPEGPKVENIELSESKIGLRLVLAVAALLAGVLTITWAVSAALGASEGWTELTVSDSETAGSGSLTLMYNLGQGETSASREKKAISALYGEISDRAYRLFDAAVLYDGVVNTAYLNAHPNETLEVDPLLYDALALMLDRGGDRLYLGPLLEEYDGLFSAQSEEEAASFDAESNPAVAEYFDAVLALIQNGDIRLELLGENRVRLSVTEVGLAAAEQWEIERFLDFGCCRSALLLDACADALREAGYETGYLVTEEGHVRCLGEGISVSLPLYACENGTVTYEGQQELTALCAVTLRSFPVTAGEYGYQVIAGEYRHPYISPATGRCTLSAPFTLQVSDEASLTALLLQTLDFLQQNS